MESWIMIVWVTEICFYRSQTLYGLYMNGEKIISLLYLMWINNWFAFMECCANCLQFWVEKKVWIKFIHWVSLCFTKIGKNKQHIACGIRIYFSDLLWYCPDQIIIGINSNKHYLWERINWMVFFRRKPKFAKLLKVWRSLPSSCSFIPVIQTRCL